MPFALFLISLLVSTSVYASTTRVSQDAFVNRSLMESTGAFYVASSSAEITWSDTRAENSTARQRSTATEATDKTGASGDENKTVLDDNLGADDQLLIAKAVETRSDRSQLKINQASLLSTQVMPAAEVFLYDVSEAEVVDSILLEYCDEDSASSCPELIIDWFEIPEDSFRFQQIANLQDQEFDNSTLQDCLQLSNPSIQRCVVTTQKSFATDYQSGNISGAEKLKKYVRVFTTFPGNHYLFRFRTKNGDNVRFRLIGERGGERVALPTTLTESDELGRSQYSFRRIREQQSVSGGLQDSLEFSHFSNEQDQK